jgi:PAS domain S-box-containing protein
MSPFGETSRVVLKGSCEGGEEPSVELSDYVLELLREDEEFIFHRGHPRYAEGPPVLLLAPASTHPAPQTLKKIEHEYSLRSELDPTWAVRPVALSHYEGRLALVLESPGGEPLDRLMQGPMELGQFLRIAIGLATALGQLHQRELIHKDLKPSHILVDSATAQVWLTGFAIASRLPRERQSPDPPEFFAGSLPYMAPEQTGRMNRSIDSRSDLYAFGVTLYQMLTGSLPFSASDPMEWVHCHVARQAVPPSERLRHVAGPVSAIIMKLLAKTAEERYQTAAGAERDLRRCLTQRETLGRIDDFPLAERDISDRISIPEKLYGRAGEIEKLLASFDRIVAGGRPELFLVSGYSGIGKSSVVNELHRVLVPPRGLFASGKFDQYKGDIPYATLAQAFQSLIRPLLGKPEPELGRWRDELLEALGPNGQLMVDLVPELKLIIGEQPPVPDLPPQDAQRRFQLVFRRFLGVFARPEHPLSLFLDDLQWLDAATLDLLEDLLTQPDVQHLMLIGAYRDNEIGPTHPLMRKLATIREAGSAMQESVLVPLVREDLAQLIAESLHCELEHAAPLASLVHEKTGGNPFFAIQFVTALADEGLLTFDYSEGGWSWDLPRIHAQDYTDNVVDLLVGKLNRLPIETQNALRQLACLGNSADFAALRMVYQGSDCDMHGRLWEAVRAGLIFRSEGSYKFLHDRVQEAAYSLIPEESRAEAHLQIGRLLAAQISAEKPEEGVFEIVNQLNRGSHLIMSAEERERVAELNLIAGRRAKTSTAYASALKYLAAGRALLTEETWDHNYELIFAIDFLMAECELLTADMVGAERRLSMLAQRGKGGHDIAAVTRLRLTLYTTVDRSDRGMEVFLDYLRRSGTDWSLHPTRHEVMREYDRIWSLVGSRQIEELVDLPLMNNPDVLDLLDVLTEAVTPSLFVDENLCSLVICRMVNLSLQHGNSDGSCFAYVWFAIIAGPRFSNYKHGFRFGRLGYELVEQRGLRRYQARTYMSFGSIVMPWARHVQTGRDLVRRAFDAACRIGDLTFAAYCCDQIGTNLLAAGDPLAEVQPEVENGLEFARNVRFGLVVDLMTVQLGLIRTFRGLTPQFGCFNDEGFDELQCERHLASNPVLALAEFWYWTRKTQARFVAGDYASAVDASSRAQQLLWTSPSQFETAEFRFYGALSHAAAWESASPDRRHQHFEALAAHHRQLQIWAENCPENFESRAALVGAEIARIEGRDLDAMHLYERALRSARENGFPHIEGVANEVAGRSYLIRGFEKIAYAYLREARYCYLRWGATGKVRQLEEAYPQLRDEKPLAGPTSTIEAPVDQLDLATVIKVSEAVSGEMVLEKLIQSLMRIAIEHAGAERGLLVFLRGDQPQIAAEASTRQGRIEVTLRQAAVTPSELPEPMLQYAIRTRESVILDDASAENQFAADTYIRQHHARSILCLPLINQAKLIGLLYLENNLTSHVFTPSRISVLKLLATQAAIALENTRLYGDLQEREAKIRRLVEADIIGIVIWKVSGQITEANEAFLRMVGYGRDDLVSGGVSWREITPDRWRAADDQALAELAATGVCDPFQKECFRKDGSRVPVLVRAALLEGRRDEGVAFVLDLSEQKRTEHALRESETRLQAFFENSPSLIFLKDLLGRYLYVNQEFTRAFRLTDKQAKGKRDDELFSAEQAATFQANDRQVLEAGVPIECEEVALQEDGLHTSIVNKFPLFNAEGETYAIGGIATDITQRKREEAARRDSEERHRVIVETASDAVISANESGTILLANPATTRVFGYDPAELIGQPLTILMPEYMREKHECGFRGYMATGQKHINWQGTALIGLRKNGEEFPVEVSFGELTRSGHRTFTGFIRDVSEQKRARAALESAFSEIKLLKDQLYRENLALREEVDRASMFEEIVGTSTVLQAVLDRVAKVAPTDSTVLITGETGTGKELIARAVHKRSHRAGRAFVSVNCAALPPSLISSELFGHEKGAFTGATQRRLGRFELADGGTIFLDEVGELPPDTQSTLLRVLQERQLERVGGAQPITVDVRVITATNRDLKAATSNGAFRLDLFYRLNVFPLEVPPLRERKDDILMLLEYFVQRFANRAGKHFGAIDKQTFERLQSYEWPGNIRELQNVVERSVILSSGDVFSIDESWLSKELRQPGPRVDVSRPSEKESRGEREIIEAALAESRGRVAGPKGAAAKLRMPASTLYSRIKALNIRKGDFKFD